jgi:hypothetical protein
MVQYQIWYNTKYGTIPNKGTSVGEQNWIIRARIELKIHLTIDPGR